ncbi:MAG: tetratricopeptide repeat protein, partial [Elusimicrobiota bacterium]
WDSVLKDDPANYEALWKLARAHWWLATYGSPQAGDVEKLAIFEKGIAWAKLAVTADLKGTQGHYWLGVCQGRYGEVKGPLKSYFLVKSIRREMEAVLAIDPDHAGAHYVLSVVYWKAPGKPLSIGSNKKALYHAKRAVALEPASLRYRLGLAEVYIEMDDKAKAKEILSEVVAMPPDGEYLPESQEDKEYAQKLLGGL